MFENKTILITGGTGSFGVAMLRRLLELGVGQVRIFSRDEKKQDDLRREISNSKVRFYIGDVRDKRSVDDAMRGVDYVFHAAALKQVPSCEFFPMQAVRTNVHGTENVLDSAIKYGVKKVIAISTDKAAYPICAMGISKAMMEKVAIAKARDLEDNQTTICCIRFGNVAASRGSVVPLFLEQIQNGRPITVTDPCMTRFMMTLDEALKLILFAFERGKNGDLFVLKTPATTIGQLAETLRDIYKSNVDINIIGPRHSEKMYETLVTAEEMAKAEDMGDFYRIPCDTRDLNYNFYQDSIIDSRKYTDYNSDNTRQMTTKELHEMLLKLDLVKTNTL